MRQYNSFSENDQSNIRTGHDTLTIPNPSFRRYHISRTDELLVGV